MSILSPKFYLALTAVVLPLAAQDIRYELSFPNAAHHEADVRVTFTGIRQPVLEIVMSRSAPGRYAVHDFAKNVYNLRAADPAGRPLVVDHATPYQWNVSGHRGTVIVDYTVYGDRADGTFDGIDSTHAHLNLPSTLVWAHGLERSPVSVKFALPQGSNWQVATQLTRRDDTTWSAPNLDRMMDAPVELGPHSIHSWKVGNSKFRTVLHHQGSESQAAAYAVLGEAVTIEEEGVFGEFPKFEDGYTFFLDYLPYVSGDGMEHRDSTFITGTGNINDNAVNMIGTLSHEFFHAWNVKRIRPRSLEPFDFERANMSGELWFAEGFTNYYGPLALERAGLWNLDRFTRSMGDAVSTVLTAPGRLVNNVIEMSRMAPFLDGAATRDPVNFSNTSISYYTYGQALALGIDLSIRAQFPGKTLDDWMRQMWRSHPDVQNPYTLEDLERTLADVTSREFAGQIFTRHIRGLEPMNYDALLARAGLLLEPAVTNKVWLGAQGMTFSERGAALSAGTLRGSPLYNAGLDRGDRIVEWKSQVELDGWLQSHKPGDRVKLQVETRGGRKEVDVTLTAPPDLRIVPYEVAGRNLAPGEKAFRAAWLSSKAIRPLPKILKYCHQCKRQFPSDYEKCPYDGSDLHITP